MCIRDSYACLNGDRVRLDVSTGLETVLKRRFLTESRSPRGFLGDRVLWDTTETDDPSTRVLSLMQDDYSCLLYTSSWSAARRWPSAGL